MIKNKIVLVPFPFDDFSKSKVRPALCLTNEIGEFEHIVIAFVSSKISNSELNSDIIIKKDSDLSNGTGLLVDSVLKLHKLVTIPKSLIKRELGVLDDSTKKLVNTKLKVLFDIN